MAKFRKKPVVIEAMRWTGDNFDEVVEFVGGSNDEFISCSNLVLSIKTLEGTMAASEGDWIIRGVKNEFYPCKPDIFAATYEPAENQK